MRGTCNPIPQYGSWWEREKDKVACRIVTDYYKHWQKRQWTQQQAANALLDVERKVTHWVGAERARELLP